VPEEDWDRVIAINLKGVFLGMKYQIPAMLRAGAGSIVNNASIYGLRATPTSPAYVASKHAVVGVTKSAALAYARAGIRVNAVCPGFIDTPLLTPYFERQPEMKAAIIAMEPIGRLGTPEEVASAVLWLCSDAASFVTGSAMAVDGGFLA
jgi:NAD(P)-dependent dehydrogenase (short-subunit alcohol dehydrogenase family)